MTHPSTVFRAERDRLHLSQKQVGVKLALSENAIRSFESGLRRLHPEYVTKAVRVFGSPRISQAYCGHCQANLFVPPHLDVDTHPMTEISVVFAECEEACNSIRCLELRNKMSPNDLTDPDRRRVEYAIDQVLDLIPLATTFAAAVCARYGFDIVEQARKHRNKLEARFVGKEMAA